MIQNYRRLTPFAILERRPNIYCRRIDLDAGLFTVLSFHRQAVLYCIKF